ncbi:hypothetical protein Metho_2714 (plasmid) [Methanomethylovorans hollandica DSM 15978]|uniref:Uncharacterized protein n=1 Tax=Methanomethylovorans hollandica (strain DSM 15978 / NBRC 107637 / DMS1) TaxID=867904 RepID=L0KZK0_METHD|nr:hypothetical protein [Methanomethylovorans hollandica]AGB50842.1 hypothetical protein Metho_2714 [Methanomethylovorans hollandica DSM 15978]
MKITILLQFEKMKKNIHLMSEIADIPRDNIEWKNESTAANGKGSPTPSHSINYFSLSFPRTPILTLRALTINGIVPLL